MRFWGRFCVFFATSPMHSDEKGISTIAEIWPFLRRLQKRGSELHASMLRKWAGQTPGMGVGHRVGGYHEVSATDVGRDVVRLPDGCDHAFRRERSGSHLE